MDIEAKLGQEHQLEKICCDEKNKLNFTSITEISDLNNALN